MGSLHIGACLWNAVCWDRHISWFISLGCVRMLLVLSLRQSIEVLIVGLNICLWIIMDMRLSVFLYLVMVFMQLMGVCLVVIFWASLLAIFFL